MNQEGIIVPATDCNIACRLTSNIQTWWPSISLVEGHVISIKAFRPSVIGVALLKVKALR